MGMILWVVFGTALPSAKAACPEPPESGDLGRKGLGQRDFPKALRHEFDLFGGVYANNLMGIAPLAGVSYTFHVNEDFALETDFAYTRFSSILAEPVKSYTGYDFLESHDARLFSGNLVWHPFHGKFLFFQSAIPHFDLFLLAGAGVTDSRLSKGLTYTAGAGIKIFCASWLSLRLDVRDHIFVQEVLASETLTNNLSVTLGVGFWIPPAS